MHCCAFFRIVGQTGAHLPSHVVHVVRNTRFIESMPLLLPFYPRATQKQFSVIYGDGEGLVQLDGTELD